MHSIDLDFKSVPSGPHCYILPAEQFLFMRSIPISCVLPCGGFRRTLDCIEKCHKRHCQELYYSTDIFLFNTQVCHHVIGEKYFALTWFVLEKSTLADSYPLVTVQMFEYLNQYFFFFLVIEIRLTDLHFFSVFWRQELWVPFSVFWNFTCPYSVLKIIAKGSEITSASSLSTLRWLSSGPASLKTPSFSK